WEPRRAETVGNRVRGRPEGADDPARVEADAAGRDATPSREAPQLAPRTPAPAAAGQRQAATPTKTPVCRDPRIDGTMIPQLVHPSWPCGIAQPVRINAIAGIRLSTPATLDCNTASRFATWVTGVLAPAARQQLGAGVETLWVMGSYACRRRNNIPSGKLSEHGRGRAIDIGGFWLDDGRKVTLAGGWGKGAEGAVLAQARARACGLFHTVLGPGSDRHHDDHLHLDTSPRGGEPYCR
ncbi:MAG TPA: extensin family protein, partial [Thermohalobaculum sp.]|nr:extensin family protein [Thermohalobaculum sp.]